jgi:aminopeptidase C
LDKPNVIGVVVHITRELDYTCISLLLKKLGINLYSKHWFGIGKVKMNRSGIVTTEWYNHDSVLKKPQPFSNVGEVKYSSSLIV